MPLERVQNEGLMGDFSDVNIATCGSAHLECAAAHGQAAVCARRARRYVHWQIRADISGMRSTAGFIGVVAVLGAAYYIYNAQLTKTSTATGGASPQQQIDMTAVRASLMEIGNAERIYVNAHGSYGTLDQLRADGPSHLGAEQRGYVFQVEPNGAQGFRATATPSAAGGGGPTFTIDETMTVTSR